MKPLSKKAKRRRFSALRKLMREPSVIESQAITNAMEKAGRVVAVDLDGTLAGDSAGWKGFHHIGKPNPKVVAWVRMEKKRGSRVVLFTCRITTLDNKIMPLSLDTIRKWLKKHKIPCDEIWMGTGKPWATRYIDDKAVNPFCVECVTRYTSEPAKE